MDTGDQDLLNVFYFISTEVCSLIYKIKCIRNGRTPKIGWLELYLWIDSENSRNNPGPCVCLFVCIDHLQKDLAHSFKNNRERVINRCTLHSYPLTESLLSSDTPEGHFALFFP